MTNSISQKVVAAGNAAANHNAIQVMVFENPEFGRIRTMTDKKGYPLFCGKDVCEALGYRKPDVAVRQHVTARDVTKRYVGLMVGKKKDGTPIVQQRQILFVTESGLYALIFGSKLDTAQKFKHWVTSVVLPQIRKTGGFVPLHEDDTDEDIRRRAEEVLRKTLQEKDSFIAQQNKLIAEQETENRPPAAEGSLRRQCAGQYILLHHHADSQGAGHDGAEAEPTALRRACAVLPEWTVHAVCGVCSPWAGEEPHALRLVCRKGYRLYEDVSRVDGEGAQVHSPKGKRVKK